jgi:tRNA modification GTPase
VVVVNKEDLGLRVREQDLAPHEPAVCSMTRQTGLDELRRAVVSRLGVGSSLETGAAISGRHYHIIQNALNNMNDAEALLATRNDEFIVLAANTIRAALRELGKVTGQEYTEELLNSIFSRFCVGK